MECEMVNNICMIFVGVSWLSGVTMEQCKWMYVSIWICSDAVVEKNDSNSFVVQCHEKLK